MPADSTAAPAPSLPTPPADPTRTSWAWLIATFFYIGNLKPGPGTWASVATLLLWWMAARSISDPLHAALAALLLSIVITWIGTLASNHVVRESGIKDPGFVVIDEVAGQMIAMIAVPAQWKYLLASLILFRIFDILKPPPLRRFELLPAGLGVMMDDVGAGIYARLTLALVAWTGLLR